MSRLCRSHAESGQVKVLIWGDAGEHHSASFITRPEPLVCVWRLLIIAARWLSILQALQDLILNAPRAYLTRMRRCAKACLQSQIRIVQESGQSDSQLRRRGTGCFTQMWSTTVTPSCRTQRSRSLQSLSFASFRRLKLFGWRSQSA